VPRRRHDQRAGARQLRRQRDLIDGVGASRLATASILVLRRSAAVATDAAQAGALTPRAPLLARPPALAHHGSGEIFVAFSTAARDRDDRPPQRLERTSVPDGRLDPLFAATVEATEEAVLNALWAAVDTTGREGRLVRSLPHEPVLTLTRHGRLGSVGDTTSALRARHPHRDRARIAPLAWLIRTTDLLPPFR
jgi:L-aminopeptidase/D-esterase-like protein